ncbi:MAG TPA: acyl-CoA desaturase [Stellaceae bacterium]|nr:acyl-CoA desaturase [Stellaceae bacterium]
MPAGTSPSRAQVDRGRPSAAARASARTATAGAAEPLAAASVARHYGVALIPLIGTIAALVLWCFGRGPGAVEIGLLAVFYVLNILGMEVALHRYFAHRAFKAGGATTVVLAILGSLAYMGPLMWWVAIHRLHHAHSDTAGDPHTPQLGGDGVKGRARGLLHGHVGWLFDPASARPRHWNRYARDLYRDPTLLRIHLAYDYWLALGLLLPAVLGGALHMSWQGALLGFLWGGTVRILLATNAIWAVNSLGHAVGGRRPFAAGKDQSRNSPWLALVTLGAGWHNNHHAFPSYASTGFRWWQIDMSAWVIALLERLGLVWDVRRPQSAVVEARLKRAPEQAAIALDRPT